MFDKYTDRKKANRLINVLKKAGAKVPQDLQ